MGPQPDKAVTSSCEPLFGVVLSLGHQLGHQLPPGLPFTPYAKPRQSAKLTAASIPLLA
jgi:hypothetical protein